MGEDPRKLRDVHKQNESSSTSHMRGMQRRFIVKFRFNNKKYLWDWMLLDVVADDGRYCKTGLRGDERLSESVELLSP